MSTVGKRKFLKMSHEMILARIADGSLFVDIVAGVVYRTVRGERVPLRVERDKCGYPFVRLYRGEHRIGISVHRLVWIAAHQQPIPEGHEVHHEDTNINNNCWVNLELLSKPEHAAEHGRGYPAEWDEEETF